MTGIVALPRKIAALVSASGALAKGKHTPVDATSGARTMTLPTGAAEGVTISVEKVDSSANAVSITGNIRGVGSSTLTLPWQHESKTFVADSAGSWWPTADTKTKASFDAAFAPRWQASTAYTAGQAVVAPDGTLVTARAAFTSGSTYDPTNWLPAITTPGTLGQQALRASTVHDLTPLAGAVCLHRNASETNGSPKVYRTNDGVKLDTVIQTGIYAHFGPASQADSVLSAVISHDSSYALFADGTWGDGGSHVGVCMRFATSADFGLIAMHSVRDNTVQVAYKKADAETVMLHVTPTTGTFYYGQRVRYDISVVGTAVTITWTDDATGTLMHTYSYTITGTPQASGQCALHGYNAVATLWNHSVTLKSGTGAALAAGPLFAAINAGDTTNGAGLSTSGNTWVMTTDGTGSGNPSTNWGMAVTGLRFKNGTIKGTLNRTSGRMMGIGFRLDSTGAGYYLTYDNNGPYLRLLKGVADAASTVGANVSTTIATGSDLPFVITVHGPLIQFTINGVTAQWVDSTYTAEGFVCLVGYGGVHVTKDLVVYPVTA